DARQKANADAEKKTAGTAWHERLVAARNRFNERRFGAEVGTILALPAGEAWAQLLLLARRDRHAAARGLFQLTLECVAAKMAPIPEIRARFLAQLRESASPADYALVAGEQDAEVRWSKNRSDECEGAGLGFEALKRQFKGSEWDGT